ncbi:uncharacterized protein LOC129263279 isoform X2 [Lytechinus pictus]|uniref:uncharacterized protein LOC129263279 isoform X2 n=1 Tax=Lytechinus pictus TaxID=7653 RepID=UPI0030B9F88B
MARVSQLPAAFQISGAVFLIIFGIVAIVLSCKWSYFAAPIIVGILILGPTGIIGICFSRRGIALSPTRHRSYRVLSCISSLISLALVAFYCSVAALEDASQCTPGLMSSSFSCEQLETRRAIDGVVAAVACLEFIVCIQIGLEVQWCTCLGRRATATKNLDGGNFSLPETASEKKPKGADNTGYEGGDNENTIIRRKKLVGGDMRGIRRTTKYPASTNDLLDTRMFKSTGPTQDLEELCGPPSVPRNISEGLDELGAGASGGVRMPDSELFLPHSRLEKLAVHDQFLDDMEEDPDDDDPDMSSQMIHPSRGGTIMLPAHGISLFIPVWALRKECRITMKVLPQPSSPLITEDEAFVSPGVIFEPSGTIFDTPLRLVVPHCAILTDPSMAMVNMHVTQGDKVTKEELSPTGMPRCVVRQDMIEVYINHFSICEMFVVISDYFLGKRVASTPYLPKSLSRLQPQCCHLRLYNDTPGLEDIIGTEEEKLGYVKMAPTKKIFVLWEKGELKIKCDVNSGHVTESEKAVSLDEIYRLDRNVLNFLVKASGNSDVFFTFQFRPHCDDGHAFSAKFGDITDAPKGSLSAPEPDGATSSGSPNGAQTKSESSSASSKRLDDKVLYDLANEIENDDHLDRLMQALKVPSGAQQRCHDLNRLEGQVTARGTHRILMDWRAETAVAEQHDRLKGALTDAKLLDLRDRFFSLEIT